jgi:hypothetical protein
MARRNHPRYSNQKHKHLKRPRSWHRSCLKTIDQIAEELGVENQADGVARYLSVDDEREEVEE